LDTKITKQLETIDRLEHRMNSLEAPGEVGANYGLKTLTTRICTTFKKLPKLLTNKQRKAWPSLASPNKPRLCSRPGPRSRPISAREPSLDDTLEERMEFAWEAFRMQIPMFESLKAGLSKLQRGVSRSKIIMTQLENA
jgi:hypothetical protein